VRQLVQLQQVDADVGVLLEGGQHLRDEAPAGRICSISAGVRYSITRAILTYGPIQ
jgi:hypothetical protein